MSKIIIILLAIFLIGGGLWVGSFMAKKMAVTPNIVLPTSQPVALASPTPPSDVQGVTISAPQTLNISKINVSAAVESVSKDSEGRMDVPKDADNVAWYNLGPRLGEKGNVVIAGHFDRVDGSPAIFYNLANLNIGDEIEVTDASGSKFKYKVTDKKNYPVESFPLQEVFGATDKYRLNLITCEGTFNRSVNSYSHRTVVYSELVK